MDLRTVTREASVNAAMSSAGWGTGVEPGPVGVGRQGQTTTWTGMAGSSVEKGKYENNDKGSLGMPP